MDTFKLLENRQHETRVYQVTLDIFLLAVSLFRVWLYAGAFWQIRTDTTHDDKLTINTAASIIGGHWTSESYNNLAMAKNPGYPMFLALCKKLNISYGVGIALFTILACAVFCLALRPVIKNSTVLAALYTAMLFVPSHYSSAYRIYRLAATPQAALLAIGCIAGLYIRRLERLRSRIIWGIGAMFSVAVFWSMREDHIWLLPLIACVTLLLFVGDLLRTLASFRRERKSENKKSKEASPASGKIGAKAFIRRFAPVLLSALLPISGILLENIAISSINYAHFGVFAENDRSHTNFARMMSLLYKIEDDVRDPDIWCTRTTLAYARQASETLNSLESLDMYLNAWANSTQTNDLPGDINAWAIRDAAQADGHYVDGKETNEFFGKVCDELEEGFKTGKLRKKEGLYLSSQTGVFHISDFKEAFKLSLGVFWRITKCQLCTVDLEDNLQYDIDASDAGLRRWEAVIGQPLPRTDAQLAEAGADEYSVFVNDNLFAQVHRTANTWFVIVAIYRVILMVTRFIAIAAYIAITVLWIMRKVTPFKTRAVFDIYLIGVGMSASAFVNIYAVLLFGRWLGRNVETCAGYSYGSSAYALEAGTIFLGLFLAGCLLHRYMRYRRVKRKTA